ncbi:MAG: Penicillin amidase [Bacteroidetes bacterium]|nr:Penicillin amidase [Bacteroidota bacterium]
MGFFVSKKAKIIIGLLSVIISLGIMTFFFLRYQIRKSFPQTIGSMSVVGLENQVQVIRDRFGVPRIEAANEHDLMLALGYVHAQDRLWQMDMVRRVGEGRLSELFGFETLPFDKMFRIVGIRSISEKIEQNITQDSRNRLQWYADGVNAFITSNKGKYPIEFDMLRYDPEPWRPVHSIMVGRLMAWELNLSWWTDITYGAIAERVGLEKALDIFPPFPQNVGPIVPTEAWRKYASLTRDFLKTSQSFSALWGAGGILGGSNAWVVAPSKSRSGKVILANDTHLQLQSPSKWYEVQLHSPEYEVSGMSIPGVPGIVAGQNKHIAWGLTALMSDEADFYIERIDTSDGQKYYYDGEWRLLTVREEEIHIKGDTVVPVIIRSTHHGPIVTDIHTFLKKSSSPYVASMRWTGTEISDQVEAFNKINRATNWEEFTKGVSEFSGPGQNFVYGDAQGNIGYWCGVKLPLRGKQSTLLPLPGWDPTTEWKGFVPFNKLPHLFNPPEGYIATANNKVVDDSYPYYISDLWEPASRIVRLREVLGSQSTFSVQDFERLQNDMFSHQTKRMMPHVLSALKDSTLGVPEEKTVMEYLQSWNFTLAREDIATTIYEEFFVKLIGNIFKDEMGDSLFHDWVVLMNVPIRVTTKLVEEGTSNWFDDVGTDSIETRDQIIRKSMREAISFLRDSVSTQTKNWRWGDVHTVTLKHPFGLVKSLDRLFNIGPFPYGGGPTTLVSGEFSLNAPFQVTVGASFRQIFDFANPDEWRAILPSGQSGQVLHEHYDDQAQMWLNGAYRTVTSRRDGGKWERLTLEPSK